MYSVREWSIDFVEQSHISNARNWIAAVCHEIKETVSLERCKCGKHYEQWDRRLAPSCSKCAKNHVRKASLGKTGTEQGGSKGKRAKCDSSDGKCERKREKIQHPQKPVKKTKTQADMAKCTIRMSKHHFSPTFSTHLGGWEGRSPVGRGCGAQPRDFFF